MRQIRPQLDEMPAVGRIMLFDFVSTSELEPALAFKSVLRELAEKSQGRLMWAGHLHQILIGQTNLSFTGVFVSEFPGREQAILALVERTQWGIEDLIQRSASYFATPRSRIRQNGASFLARALGRGIPSADPPSTYIDQLSANPSDGVAAVAPTGDQLNQFVHSNIEGKTVLFCLSEESPPPSASPTASSPWALAGDDIGRAFQSGRYGARYRLLADAVHPLDSQDTLSWARASAVEFPTRSSILQYLAEARENQIGLPGGETSSAALQVLACTSHAEFF